MKINNDTLKGFVFGIAVSFLFIELLDFVLKIILIFGK